MKLLSLAVLLPGVLAADSLRVLHRVYHPSLPSEQFTERGSLLLSGPGLHQSASLVSSEALQADFSAFTEKLQGIDSRHAALYQVALEHPGDTHHTQWHVSAVKACHLPQATSEKMILHLAADGAPFALDYFVGPVPHNGACPRSTRNKHAQLKSNPDAPGSAPNALEFKPITNSTVLVRAPTVPPLPQLRVPPPLTAEGRPAEAPQEKTFIQKYWIYIAVALVALTLAPAPEEESQGARR